MPRRARAQRTWDVARAEVVERLVAVARAEELLLARARAHGTVRRVHREPGTRRHQTEQLPEELRRVGRPDAVELDQPVLLGGRRGPGLTSV